MSEKQKSKSKPEESSKTEKAPNKATSDAGLTFNVNTVKSKLKDYYSSQNMTKVMFSGGQTVMTAVLEKLFVKILENCCDKGIPKDKTNMMCLRADLIHETILINPDFKEYFSAAFDKYDPKLTYADQIPIIKSDMEKVMNQYNPNLMWNNNGYNLMCYLLLKTFFNMACMAHEFLSFAKKKSLDGSCIMHVTRASFPQSLGEELCNHISRLVKSMPEQPEEGDEPTEPEPTKKTKPKKIEDDQEDLVEDEQDETDSKSEKSDSKTKKTSNPTKMK